MKVYEKIDSKGTWGDSLITLCKDQVVSGWIVASFKSKAKV